jgi:uncharacterized membrane protein
MNRRFSSVTIALVAVLIALTTVFTLLIRVPTPARGYVNLSDVAVTFASLAFGPWVGMLAGGIGAGLADLLGGFAPFAPLSLVAHGLEGLVIGLIAWRRHSLPIMVVAWLAGGLIMAACYLVGEGLFLTQWPAALAEAPLNLFQALVGAVVGIPLVLAVRRAYPPVDQLGQPRTWTD